MPPAAISTRISANTSISIVRRGESLIDIANGEIRVAGLPAAPEGTIVDRVDVIVRLKRA